MTMRIGFRDVVVLFALVAVLAAFLAGCKSTPKIDWNSRVGYYTYDQAVMELGPPDKFTTLSDGGIVADWISCSNSSVSFGVGTARYGNNGSVGVGASSSSGYREKVLRLTFGPDHKLIAWSGKY